jgi:uncharacterized Fe-S cluster-containing radical SAM superfamily protein
MGQYTGVDLAPYYRFRPTDFYDSVFPNGTFTADIAGCNWTCEHCWSKYGWRGLTVEGFHRSGGEMTSEQVADKLVLGMERNLQPMCRISGGEASMYWDPHMVGVIRGVLQRTQGQRMRIRGKTEPGVGAPMGICIETNGSVLTVAQLKALEDEFGEETKRIVLAVGMKATNASELARLTGMTAATAERFHKGQMRTLRWLVDAEHLGWFANFIDEFAAPEEYAKLVREIERKRPGSARLMGVDPYRRGYSTNRYYTPKRGRVAPVDGVSG